MYLLQENVSTVEKKHLQLLFPYLRTESLQTWNDLPKSINEVLSCCVLQVVFKKLHDFVNC